MAPKPNYEKPASQVDLEARLKDDYVSPSVLTVAEDPVVTSENGFVGVDPIYQNFANDTHKPYAAEKGVEQKLEQGAVSGVALYDDDTDFDAGATPEGEADAETEEDKAETPQSAGGTTPTSPTPPSGQNPS